MAEEKSTNFKVIIAGAGFAGLGLANCLELAGIPYLVLEGRDAVGSDIGGPMSVLAGPVMEQLGMYDKYYDLISIWHGLIVHKGNGDYIQSAPDRFRFIQTRSGYPRGMADRSDIIQLLFNHIPDKEQKILTGKKISRVEHSTDGIIAHCADGSSYPGDIIAGADGVHSTVLQEMWRISDQGPNPIPEADRKPFTVDFKCIGGTFKANLEYDIRPGVFNLLSDQDFTAFYATSGKDESIITAVEKLDRTYKAGELRWTKAEADQVAASHADRPLMPNGSLKFGDLWKHCGRKFIVPIEAGVHDHVTWGRIVMLGDSVHKSSPVVGYGSGLSMTAAAALTNVLRRLLENSKGTKPTHQAICSALLNDFQNTRMARCRKATETTNFMAKIVSTDNWIIRFFMYIGRFQDPDTQAELVASLEVGAEMLDFVPPPKGALTATMPYNRLVGHGHEEPISGRILRALPFLGLSILALQVLNTASILPMFSPILESGVIEWSYGSFPIYDSFSGLKSLDDILKVVTTFFAQWTFRFDELGLWHARVFLCDVGLLYSIIVIESARRANDFTLVMLPALFGMLSQFMGGAVILPIYFFIHYSSSRMDKFKALDQRLTNLQYTRSVFVAVALGYYFPLFMFLVAPASNETRYFWSWIWQVFPILISIIQYVLAFVVIPSTIATDRIYAPTKDIPAIRFVIFTLSSVSAASWLYTNIQVPFTWEELYVPSWSAPTDIVAYCLHFMQWDYIIVFTSASLWMTLLFHDMKKTDMIQTSWPVLLLMAMTTFTVAGPGVTVGLAWLWRENALATGKMKGAITLDSWNKARN